MTSTEHDAPAVELRELGSAQAQAHARNAWRRSGGRLTGAELGRRYGRSERWGRQQIAAARADRDGNGGPESAPPATSGTASTAPVLRPDGSAARPARANGSGTTGTARPARTGTAPQQPAGVPLPLLAATAAAVVVVTVVCAVVSYSHIRDLARAAGMGGLAGWLPLGVDGLVVAASCSLIVDRQLGRPGHALAWAGVALGLAGSLAANVMAVDPALVSLRAVRWVLAGYGPAALAVSGHLLFRMLGDRCAAVSPNSTSKQVVGAELQLRPHR
jgi:Protein of unknown function (DUF2637)